MIQAECSLQPLIILLLRNKKIDPIDWVFYLHRVNILHWIIKLKWNSKHKIPKFPNNVKDKDYKPCYLVLAELYVTVVDLCCLHFSRELTVYQNSANWFAHILYEGTVQSGDCSGKKTVDIKTVQKQNVNLDNGINPINRNESPHTWKLIEIAKHGIGNKVQESTEEELWQLFIQRRKAWITEYKRPEWKATRIVNQELRVSNTNLESSLYLPTVKR
jgi:hypothetical protein